MAFDPVSAIGGLVPVVGGILGSLFGGPDRDKANAAAQAAYQEIVDLGAPPNLAAPILMKHFQQAGILTPELEKQINLGVSKVGQIQEDPTLRNAQMSALDQLKNRSQTGLTATDRQRLNDLLTKTNKNNTANQNSIIQNLQSRGQGGSGAELAARLSGVQNDNNNASDQTLGIASQANQAALDSLSKFGDLSGNIRAQDFSNANTKAAASDEFNRFNISNQIAQQQRNVDRSNSSQQYNLQNQQDVANKNVNVDNDELLRQRQAQQTQYQLAQQNAQSKSAAKLGQANVIAGQAANTAQNWATGSAGVGNAVAAGVNADNNSKRNTLDDQKHKLDLAKFKEQYGYDPTQG